MRSLILFTVFLLLSKGILYSQNAYYKVKFPDDETIIGCYAYPDTVYPEITQYSNCTFNVGVSVKDQVFNLNAWGGCKKILRTWTLLYWCDYDPNYWPVYIQNPPDTDIGATVFGIPSNHGYLTYTQIIKVVDLDPPAFANCPTDPIEFCDYTGNDASQYNNGHTDKCEGPVDLGIKVTDLCSEDDIQLSYRLFLDLDCNGSMETYVSSSSPNAWPINKMTGDTVMASIDFPAGFGLPYATHKIEWIANDNCGNQSICKYEFTVKDCKAPTVVCLNGLSINIMSTGMITLWDTDFIQYMQDNCTPTSQLKIGIRKAGTGTGFPTDSHSVTFDCSELGTQEVEIWAEDAYGNADYCLTYVIVQDNIGSCPPSNKFKGSVVNADLKPMPGVQLTLKKSNQNKANVITDALGQFEIGSMTSGCNYKLIPALDATAKVGLNTLDALLLAGHLDNMKPLGSPYKLLAADVNKSGGINADDVMGIVKVVLGAQADFPGLPAWQFVPGSYTFPNPAAPWSNAIPSSLTFCLSGAMPTPAADFVGFKTGDLNGTASSTNFTSTGDDRSSSALEKRAIFRTLDRTFVAGEEVRVDIITPDLAGFTGFQFTLDFDPAVLTLANVEPDLLPSGFIATPAAASITASWHSTTLLNPNVTAKNIFLRTFTLVFTALKEGTLSEVLQMTSSVTPAEAYTRSLRPVAATLQFQTTPGAGIAGAAPSLFPVWPNPVQDHVTAAFYLPEPGNTTLQVTDATGQVLQSIEAFRERGYHQVDIELGTSAPSGLLFIRLDGPGGGDVKRVMKF